MCGRYAQAKDPATLADEFDALDATDGGWSGPDHNVAPTTTVLGVVDRHPRDDRGTPDPQRLERSLRPMRWGLVPSWADDPAAGSRMINARADSLVDKPAFRRAARGRRCLLPADGWFEWLRDEHGRTPFFMTLPSGRSLALAGLWETWRAKGSAGADARPLVSTAVVTVDAVGPLREIHHRMPLVLPSERWADWLDPDRADPTALLEPPPEELVASLERRRISTRVNSVAHHGPELLEPVSGGSAPAGGAEQIGLDLDVPASS